MLNLHLCNKVFYSIIVYVFFLVIYMCCARLHYLCFLSVRGAVVVLDCEILYICSFNPSSVAVGLTATLEISYCFFFMKPRHYSRELASGPYPERAEFSQRSYILFNFRFNFVRNSTCGCPKLYVPSVFPIYIYIYKFFLCILIQDTGLLVPPFSRSLIC